MYRIPNFLTRVLSLALVPVVFGFFQGAVGQDSKPSQDPSHQEDSAHQPDPSKETHAPPAQSAPDEKATPIEAHSSALTLGPGDEMDVAVYGAPDLSGHTRVSSDGNISMPLVGYIHVAGLTSSEAEGEIRLADC